MKMATVHAKNAPYLMSFSNMMCDASRQVIVSPM